MDVDFDTLIPQLRKAVENVMMDEISKMAKDSQKANKQREVYDVYDPAQYQRTYEFLNANDTVMDSRQYKNNIYMYVYTPTTLEWMPSRHVSFVDGSNQNKNIPYYILHGNNSPIFSYQARDYITPTRDEIDRKLKQTVIQGLRRYGITAI